MNNDQVSSVAFFIFGIIICFASVKYKLGDLRTPGVGFLPFLVGLTICLSSLIGFSQAIKKRKEAVIWKSPLEAVKWKKGCIVLIALFAYALLLTPLGYSICTFFFMGFLLRLIKPQKWSVVILGAIFAASGSYIIFNGLLEVQLPKGPWGF